MDDQNRNLLLAVALSALVFVLWFALFPPPEQAPSPDPSTEAVVVIARSTQEAIVVNLDGLDWTAAVTAQPRGD